MIFSTCHCGAVRIEIPGPPAVLVNCNCSICRRYGALWAQFDIGAVRIVGHPENTTVYIGGKRTLKTVRCRHCGCVTHWEPLELKDGAMLGVNMRNFEADQVSSARIRQFDGAHTWTYLD